MGSRRRRHAALIASLALAGCTAGAPPGFSKGDRWVFPLVGPLENHVLIAPVSINGSGPFLFTIDPDANTSIVDDELVKLAKLRTGEGPHRLDESDTQQARFYAEVLGLELGTLTIERQSAMLIRAHAYDIDGRRIYGVIGRDILADSLVFGFDRDLGLGFLWTTKAFTPPPDAQVIHYDVLPSRALNVEAPPLNRRVVKATVEGASFTMHLDLGAAGSQLRESEWPKAKLTAADLQGVLIDEVGATRPVSKVGSATSVAIGAATADHVTFVPYVDKRWEDEDLDGALGLDFFRQFSVWASWDARTYWLAGRREVPVTTRISRWGSAAVARCEHVGCVTVKVIDPLAGKTEPPPSPHPGVVLSIVRDSAAAGMDLEVVLDAKGAAPLPKLLVNLPATSDRVMEHLHGEFAGAEVSVIDISPYPRPCANKAGCVDLLAP